MTAPRSRLAPLAHGAPTALSTDVFDGFFDGPPHAEASEGALLDLPSAQAWLRLVEWGARTGLYTYQLPLDGMSGAHVTIGGRRFVMASSYDYLGLIGHPAVQEGAVEALRAHGTSTGGVRLLTGTVELHRALEADLAAFKGTDAAMVFTSGYMAMIGVVGALFGPRDLVVLDERAHRSTIDACTIARVPFRRFRHNDSAALADALADRPARGRTLVVVEGVYSMDGDIAPLRAIVDVARANDAYVMVDEAHSFGMLGASGLGVSEHCGVRSDEVDLWVGSLSKAIPSCGGFAAASKELIVYLQHGAAPFMFSAALAPASAGAARAALDVLRREPWRVARAHANAAHLRQRLRDLRLDIGASETCIIPVVLGGNEAAFRAARELLDLGVLASAVIPPAVPRAASRLRLCATAAHDADDIDAIGDAFVRLVDTGLLAPTASA